MGRQIYFIRPIMEQKLTVSCSCTPSTVSPLGMGIYLLHIMLFSFYSIIRHYIFLTYS